MVEDLAIAHMRGQPVAANHEDVAGLQLALVQFQIGVVVHPDRARDDVAAGPGARRLLAEGPF